MSNKHPQSINDLPDSLRRKIHHEAAVDSSEDQLNTLKQWELKNGSTVELSDGRMVKFVKMDGMYAQWEDNGTTKIGNFDEFEKTSFGYKVITNQKQND